MPKGGRREGAGRPAGARTKVTVDVKAAAQAYTADAIDTLAEIMRDRKQPAAARASAASTLLDRGHGKARQPVEHDLDLSKLTYEQLVALAAALGATAIPEQGDGGDRDAATAH